MDVFLVIHMKHAQNVKLALYYIMVNVSWVVMKDYMNIIIPVNNVKIDALNVLINQIVLSVSLDIYIKIIV